MAANRLIRLLILLIGIIACVWSIRAAALFGASRLVSRAALATRNLPAANVATSLTPNDPEAHRTNAGLLMIYDSPSEATLELERALALRPTDYAVWITLGQMRDRAGDAQGAAAAFNEAVERAPYYAQPRWQRGNFLLRAGQYDAAFTDLNLAAESNPEMLANLMDLAWSLSRENATATEELAQIKSPTSRLAFARFLASKGKGAEALEQFKKLGGVPADVRKQLVTQLLATKNYREAYELWSTGEGFVPAATPSIYDGGFEGSLKLEEKGFGWTVLTGSKVVTLSLDPNQAYSGAQSLRIAFAGESDPATPVLSQMLLVEPSKTYRINCAVRTQDILTGGPPIAVVTDTADRKLLGKSATFAHGSSDWTPLSFEFTTQPTTVAVLVGVQREGCTSGPCPVFGSIVIDNFSIQLVK